MEPDFRRSKSIDNWLQISWIFFQIPDSKIMAATATTAMKNVNQLAPPKDPVKSFRHTYLYVNKILGADN